MSGKNPRFHLYRYQLLPINRFQGDLYGAKTVDELIANKNALFREALNTPGAFHTSRTDTTTKKFFEQDDFILFHIAANRSLNHEMKDFRTETIDNWPKLLVVIWNSPDKQLIAIQHRSAAFQKTDAVARLVFDSISPVLLKHQLTESPRVLRRLQILREWSHEQIKQIFPRSSRTRCPHGARASQRVSIAMGGH